MTIYLESTQTENVSLMPLDNHRRLIVIFKHIILPPSGVHQRTVPYGTVYILRCLILENYGNVLYGTVHDEQSIVPTVQGPTIDYTDCSRSNNRLYRLFQVQQSIIPIVQGPTIDCTDCTKYNNRLYRLYKDTQSIIPIVQRLTIDCTDCTKTNNRLYRLFRDRQSIIPIVQGPTTDYTDC